MNTFIMTTPIAFLVFNRPEETAAVFKAIREVRPRHLLVVADGPRVNRPDDVKKCAKVRSIIEQVDWPCEVVCNYSETNLGCKTRVSSGLDWVFSQVEEAIILEDDCLPDSTFFRFCQEMLDQYRFDERITMISGANLLGEWKSAVQSYHFSTNGGIWGWASWRRAWQHYDVNMPLWWERASQLKISAALGGGRFYRARAIEYGRAAAGKIDTWDYQWNFAQLLHSGVAAVSAVNLVSNIGFNADATHTVNPSTLFSGIPTTPCRFPLSSYPLTTVDHDYDAAVHRLAQSERPLLLKLADLISQSCGLLPLRKFWLP